MADWSWRERPPFRPSCESAKCVDTTAVIARLDRAIQYAAASQLKHYSLWNTGSPAFAGDDTDTEHTAATLRRETRCGATIKMRLPVKPHRRDDIRAAPPFG
ncbi:hypothetical protein CK489_17160 [Bradyrhizobium sp. UFLA03-84]|uniref:hypothetical protein n=1 Tax=Bradyrhizobium sp. UFLA03-84 TaxID=418599 RepID=UPI000BAE4A35|nr:hypothetical protein [Bradyrhizobium sp. UFLA03-84]PAY07483.1 hypothetical protein CK489_17160 [Bradyrhizobium sp. UFLA03-84]